MEAIARGVVRAQRLILWLADADVVAHPPVPLVWLVERGLQIRPAADGGPRKKYCPDACSEAGPVLPLVTADDDVFYGEAWRAELLAVHQAHPDEVMAYRAHRIGMQDGKILPLYPVDPWGPAGGVLSYVSHRDLRGALSASDGAAAA